MNGENRQYPLFCSRCFKLGQVYLLGHPILPPFPGLLSISDDEFKHFQQLIYKASGIHLPATKKMLVVSRLSKRVRHHGLDSLQHYYQFITHAHHADEFQIMVDLLTTNETYFFREPEHFSQLKQLLPDYPREHPFQAWSAACSSGEEGYSMAMTLMELFGTGRAWSVLGTDISARMLHIARNAVYPINATEHIPKNYLSQYCLKGVRSQAGTFRIEKKLRDRVKFQQLNLNAPHIPHLPHFDLILLRNVLIYFDIPTKRQLIHKMIDQLRPGGYLLIGHAENLSSLSTPEIHAQLSSVAPTVYRKKLSTSGG